MQRPHGLRCGGRRAVHRGPLAVGGRQLVSSAPPDELARVGAPADGIAASPTELTSLALSSLPSYGAPVVRLESSDVGFRRIS